MNLATRCLSCGTVFRVGEEQLQASDGWVRCGRCNGVFDAAEVLFDIDTGAPMRLAKPPATAAAPADAQAPERPATPPATPSWAPPAPADRTEPRTEPRFDPPPLDGEAPAEPLLRAPSRDLDDEPIVITDHVPPPPAARVPDAAAGPDLPADSAAGQAPATVPMAVAAMAPAIAAPANPVQAPPSFLRDAERSARWRQPAVQLGLWAAVLLLALGMGLQMALLWRDNLAAHLPGTAPALQALCRLAGCSVQPLRRIQLLAVESSGLNRLEGSPLYRLQLVLRNRADTAVMMPALDLALTDPQGQPVARKVLPMAELGVPQPALQAGQELPIQVLVSTGDRRVAGYTLELFYP
jgi:predicted Zn finger-like uncharacterized protein